MKPFQAARALDAIDLLASTDAPTQIVVEDIVHRVVEVVEVEAFFVGATDPNSGLCLGAGMVYNMSPEIFCHPFWEHEFLVPDFNKFIHLSPTQPVADLREATGANSPGAPGTGRSTRPRRRAARRAPCRGVHLGDPAAQAAAHCQNTVAARVTVGALPTKSSELLSFVFNVRNASASMTKAFTVIVVHQRQWADTGAPVEPAASEDWSGYVLEGGPYTAVTGTFQVPLLFPTAGCRDTYAEWVGDSISSQALYDGPHSSAEWVVEAPASNLCSTGAHLGGFSLCNLAAFAGLTPFTEVDALGPAKEMMAVDLVQHAVQVAAQSPVWSLSELLAHGFDVTYSGLDRPAPLRLLATEPTTEHQRP